MTEEDVLHEARRCSVKECENLTKNEEFVAGLRLHICDECREKKDKPWRNREPRETLYREETEKIIHSIKTRGDQRVGQFLLNAIRGDTETELPKNPESLEEINESKHKVRSEEWSRLWGLEAYEIVEYLEERDMIAENFKTKNQVFRERNLLVKAFFSVLHQQGFKVGYRIDDDEEWPIWTIPDQKVELQHGVIRTPGQMGWHIHREEIDPEEIQWMEEIDEEYDGHSNEQKNFRLNAFSNLLSGEK